MPGPGPLRGMNRPLPVLLHAEARERTLKRYAVVRAGR